MSSGPQLRELEDKYAECMEMLHEAQEELKNLRNRTVPSTTARRYHSLGLFPMVSGALPAPPTCALLAGIVPLVRGSLSMAMCLGWGVSVSRPCAPAGLAQDTLDPHFPPKPVLVLLLPWR